MKKLLLFLIVAMTLLSGCKHRSSDVRPWPPEEDVWQRYEDGSPGVVDMRMNKKMEKNNE